MARVDNIGVRAAYDAGMQARGRYSRGEISNLKNPFNPDTRFQMHCSWKDGSDDAAIKERGRK